MAKESAGLLMFRRRGDNIEVLLAHPGGPFFAKKDAGAWSIPKGELEPGEDPLATAKREFSEETGLPQPTDVLPLASIKHKGGKIVHAWAFEGDCEPSLTVSNTFTMEWPRGSGKQVEFPEIDRAEFFDVETAKQKINQAQVRMIDELVDKIQNSNVEIRNKFE